MRFPPLFLAAAFSLLISGAIQAAVAVKDQGDGVVRVEIDGELFTEYHYTGAPHVYFYPLIGPGGARMTRDWPMKDTPGEEHDHPHHRSLWYAHGDVNGIDFWAEAASTGNKPPRMPLGTIVHEKFLELQGGEKEGTVKSQNKWVGPEGNTLLTSTQTFRLFQRPSTERVFDFEVTLTAGSAEVTMGDTKEGSMALRVAESMRVAKPKKEGGEGHMLNSEGERDAAVWGKRAKWVDYTGPVNGKTVGVAIFDHPSNPRHPTRWHARDYGLFAVNPFCEHDMDKTQPEGAGKLVIPAGQTVTFRYRFYLHEGDSDAGQLAQQAEAYAAQK